MKTNLLISLKITIVMIVLLAGIYPFIVFIIGKASPGAGEGEKVFVNGKVVGYANIGQKFTDDKYFWGRPSAVDYNAAGSAGSNKGPSNPEYLLTVQARIDSFLVHNPGVSKNQIPVDMITASGSGLDPDISPASAYIQVKRIAIVRNIDQSALSNLVKTHIERNGIGPDKINVLKLNVALDALQ